MTPQQIEKQFARLSKMLQANLSKAVQETAREGLMIARQDSSGRWNRKRRQAAGYSYSRRDPAPPPQNIAIINIEKGIFLAAWRIEPARVFASGEIAALLINDSDRVKDLVDASGKPWLSRPIDQRVAERVRPVFQFNIEKAIQKTLKG